MDTSQLLWVIYSNHPPHTQKCFLIIRCKILCFSLCLLCLVLSLGFTEKNSSILFILSVIHSCTLIRSLSNSSSAGYSVLAFSASPLMSDASAPESLLWRFIGLTPVYSCTEDPRSAASTLDESH